MAKIALILEELTAENLLLAEGLQQQRHQVRILTSTGSRRDFSTSIELLYAFSKWSLLEGMRLIPHLLRDFPDVFHFIKGPEDHFSAAELALLNMSRALKRKNVCLFKGSPDQSWRLKWPLQFIDSICFEKREALMNFKRHHLVPSKARLHVILPLSNVVPHQVNADLGAFLAEITPYVFVPGPATDKNLQFFKNAIRGTPYKLLFAGQRNAWSIDHFTLEKTTATDLKQIFSMAKTVQLTQHEFEIPELLQFRDWSLEHHVPLWVRQDQVDSVPGLIAAGRTGWVSDANSSDFAQFIHRVQAFSFQQDPQNNLPVSLHQDQILNSWNRLYSEILY